MKKRSGLYPRVDVDTAGSRLVSQAGGTVLVETVGVSGLGGALSQALARWRRPNVVHEPANVICDLAVTLGLGGGQGLSGRHRAAARAAAAVRPGCLGSDGVANHRRAGR
jgi:hypothetical protein